MEFERLEMERELEEREKKWKLGLKRELADLFFSQEVS